MSRDETPVSVFGTLADGVIGSAGATGLLRLDTAGIEIEWWVGADDGWKIPARDGVHTERLGRAPAVGAHVRVPGGEVVLRAYAVAVSARRSSSPMSRTRRPRRRWSRGWCGPRPATASAGCRSKGRRC